MDYTIDFIDTVSYGVDSINAIRSTIAKKGIIPDTVDSCKVSIDGTNIKINKGQALFGDGCRIAIDNYVLIPKIPSVKNYVYFQRNRVQNEPRPVVSDSPCGADDILLAEVDSTVIDKRVFSTLKVPLMARNHNQELTLSFDGWISGAANEWNLLKQIDLGYIGYKYAILYSKSSSYYYSIYAVQNLEDGKAVCFNERRIATNDYYFSEREGIRVLDDGYLKFEIAGNKLNCYFQSVLKPYSFDFERTYTLKLI